MILRGPAASPPRHATVNAALAAAARSPAGLVFVDAREQERSHSFDEIHQRARQVAGALRGLGVARGDRVGLVFPTGLDFMDGFFGTLLAGAVPVPLYPPVRLGRLEQFHASTAIMLQKVGASLVLTDARIRRLLGVAVERARPRLGCLTIAEVLERGGGGHEEEVGSDDLALIQFSSGTTVAPKAVALSHRNVLANAAAIDTYIPEGGPVPAAGVSWLPLYHDMGLIGCLLVAVAHPGPLTLMGPEVFLASPSRWLRAISRARAVISPAPNFAFGLCLKRVRDEELEGVDLSSWRLALNGAEPISAEVLRRFSRRFARWGLDERAVTPVYGLAEASLAVTFSAPGRAFRTTVVDALALTRGEVRAASESGARSRELVSVGVPIPGMEIAVRGADGSDTPERRIGTVHVRGPSVMTGYYGAPGATSAVTGGAWLDTGDLGFCDDGELTLCGRAKDLVILRGANHAPQEMEEALEGLAGVRAGCVVAFGFDPEGGEGEELALLVERAEERGGTPGAGDAALAQIVRSRVLERTGVRAHTVSIVAPGTIPRTSSGKLRRQEARRLFVAGTLEPPAKVTMVGMAKETVRSTVALLRVRIDDRFRRPPSRE